MTTRTRRRPTSARDGLGLRRVRVALLASLLGPLAAPGAMYAADAAVGALPALSSDVTLSAPTTGYVRVRLTRTLDLRRFNIVDSPPTFSGTGPVGFGLVPDKVGSPHRRLIIVRTPTESGAELVESPATGIDPKTGVEGEPRLLPGVYRLFFLTRGGGSVRLRMPGLPAGPRRLTATTRVPLTLGEYAAPLDANGHAPVTWEATLDYDGRKPGHVFGALWYRSTVTAYMRGGACYYTQANTASDRNAPLCSKGQAPGGTENPGPALNKRGRVWHGSYYDTPPGKQSLRVYYVSAGQVERGGALMFFLPWTA